MRRQVGHVGPNACLVLLERILEGQRQVAGLSGRQLRTASHSSPDAPETGNRKQEELTRSQRSGPGGVLASLTSAGAFPR